MNNEGVGKLVHIFSEAIQSENGTFEPLFFLPYSLHGPTLVSRSCINEIWSFNELFNGTIKITYSWIPQPHSTADESIMSLDVIFTSIKGELRQINICRTYFQAISTSNISNVDGTRITQQAFDGTFMQKAMNIRWPNQQLPTKGGWLIWHHLFQSISDANQYILQHLCSWNDVSVLYHDYELYIATPRRALIQKRGDQWFLHERQGRGNKRSLHNQHFLITCQSSMLLPKSQSITHQSNAPPISI
jgi:hypothetical protein